MKITVVIEIGKRNNNINILSVIANLGAVIMASLAINKMQSCFVWLSMNLLISYTFLFVFFLSFYYYYYI